MLYEVITGLQASMPPELMFLENFYKPQTLSAKKLQDSSFIDPFPGETVFTRLPDLVVYYITRWDHENLIMGFKECFDTEKSLESIFCDNPISLLVITSYSIHYTKLYDCL